MDKDFNSTGWKLYQSLRTINSLISSPEIDTNILDYLGKLTVTFINDFKLEFPSETITPKMHFLTHYADLIKVIINIEIISTY